MKINTSRALVLNYPLRSPIQRLRAANHHPPGNNQQPTPQGNQMLDPDPRGPRRRAELKVDADYAQAAHAAIIYKATGQTPAATHIHLHIRPTTLPTCATTSPRRQRNECQTRTPRFAPAPMLLIV